MNDCLSWWRVVKQRGDIVLNITPLLLLKPLFALYNLKRNTH